MIPGLFEVSVATKTKGTNGELGNGFGLPRANTLVKSSGRKIDLISNTVTEVIVTLRGRKTISEKAS
jgi:hypothetical protein